FSLCVLICGAPVFLLIALLIKCTSKGPFLYVGRRMGKNFKVIHSLKFRTMHIDADQRLKKLLLENETLLKEWNQFQKLRMDPRITSIGKFLRKTSLDELPGFFNVLVGDLSVVGPRPYFLIESKNHIMNNKNSLGVHAHKILSVKPGITGLWQVSGRNNLSFKKRLILDTYYIKRRSLRYDIYIILKTLPVFFFSKGAF
ncbi:MAG: sugar transferase, partial [Simkaniaceae bacterium]|nr:sugar transferase [Simkaniaceae bacterium]